MGAPVIVRVGDDLFMSVSIERVPTQTPTAVEHLLFWRGSVGDLVTDLAALLTADQLQELACEAALAWKEARG